MAVSVYEQVKKALQDIVTPELKSLQIEIKRLDEKIESMKNEMLSEIRRLDGRIDSLERELKVAVEIRERLSALETKVGIISGAG